MPNPYEFSKKNSNMQIGKGISHSNVLHGNNDSFNNNFNKNFYPSVLNFNINNNFNFENKPINICSNNHNITQLVESLAIKKELEDLQNELKKKKSSVSLNNSSNYKESPKENRIIIRPNFNKNSDDGSSYTVRTEGAYKYKGFEKKNGKILLKFSTK